MGQLVSILILEEVQVVNVTEITDNPLFVSLGMVGEAENVRLGRSFDVSQNGDRVDREGSFPGREWTFVQNADVNVRDIVKISALASSSQEEEVSHA